MCWLQSPPLELTLTRTEGATGGEWFRGSIEHFFNGYSLGRGMRVLSFVPPGGLATQPLKKDDNDKEVEQASAKMSQPKAKQGEEPSVVRGATKWKKGRPLFEHGNYSSYYGYRHAPGERGDSDRRLVALTERLGRSFFKRKEVLDIGCNAGLVSLAIAREFHAKRVVP
ncbi:unnamed protein product [Symbiodinium natans]|uniref:RNA methyltransferase n=1 Tax=Symbiodinium natans TaxID=878477 RepID=A0A812NT43_9DINO|nr:unnamed protein product [Symbiodinium natans]